MVKKEYLRFGGHVNIQVRYKIQLSEVVKIDLNLLKLLCFNSKISMHVLNSNYLKIAYIESKADCAKLGPFLVLLSTRSYS